MYNVVFRTIAKCRTQGAITWTSYQDENSFNEWYDEKMREWYEVVEKDVSPEHAIKLASSPEARKAVLASLLREAMNTLGKTLFVLSPKLGAHLKQYLCESAEPRQVEVWVLFNDPIKIPLFAGRSREMTIGLQCATEKKFAALIAYIQAIAIGEVQISLSHLTATLETTVIEKLTEHPDVMLIGLGQDFWDYEKAKEHCR